MSAAKAPAAALRPFLPADTSALASLMRDSIFALTGDDYDEDQQDAWAAVTEDEAALAARFGAALTLVATREGEPVGFLALTDNKVIDLLYVHPEVVGEGVGALLCDAAEKLATARGATSLTVDASDTALGFFQKRGFVPKSRNTVQRGGVWLGTTTMEKLLTAGDAPLH
ncbi:GNAT family N-acetyltransferase [Ancylobacter sp. WKF20]|uniref:GNAT family N-acetyltransferase n=1 Tax=Ancylobacter sp. WKF20 TaxID=3039801 RepID=UPI00243458FC|nr:GNAT family N-acetyltransferase [Ancylobacter sp. WKF20]WGD30604.1 GNAT family N-acetyltransferase [Ancylobacter sp. WKF20]